MSYFPAEMNQAISAGALRNFNIELSPGAFDVMCVLLAESANKVYNKGVSRLCYLTGFSRTKVFQCLSAIESVHLIERIKGHSRSTTYRIVGSGLGV